MGPSFDQSVDAIDDETPPFSQDMETTMGVGSIVPRNSRPLTTSDPVPSSKQSLSPKAKSVLSYQAFASPPTLRVSDGQSDGSNVNSLSSSHARVMDQVSGALVSSSAVANPEHPMSDSGEEETEGDNDDSVMSEYDDPDEPDNSMFLDQYKSGVRKETLARKVPQLSEPTHKKGRLDQGGDATQGLGTSL